ncbi:hypothetical protein GUITHDRAFT_153726 [Guillardia theta CCMP2712]|uniref:Uncharacterized protein n=1 Tax=Guillardia theta (strain CCMP2712) TaxID=905079 RepID=L1J0V8_GUITC|nr:hypothetical protein GUITHDRAFT_153726 [Guillardia theta CCMP2712]EKX41725.1 hypothetical protein GUITHDRAFT_153726 [Guillardia theta CCMP2712]|eukprot:XP_005828705.1 hypothetical protein GUITHDRAFT_153726 [Guillardia theta CCMP2712]
MVRVERTTKVGFVAFSLLVCTCCYLLSRRSASVLGGAKGAALLQGRALRQSPKIVYVHSSRRVNRGQPGRFFSLEGGDKVYDGDGEEMPLSGFGGLGRRAHFTIGPHVRRLVQQHKAKVTWRTWREEQDDGWGRTKSLRPRITLNAADRRRGATISTNQAEQVEHAEKDVLEPAVHVKEGTVHVGVVKEEEPKSVWARPAFNQDALKRQHEQGVLDYSVSSSMRGNTSLEFNKEPVESQPAEKCSPSSFCALVRQLNSEHLSGTHEIGGRAWDPSVQSSKNAVWTNSKDDEDVSSCQVCVEHYLADAGPGRFLVGSTLRRQALRGPCLPFCS